MENREWTTKGGRLLTNHTSRTQENMICSRTTGAGCVFISVAIFYHP